MTSIYTASNSLPMSALPTASGIVQKFFATAANPADATYAPDGLAAAPVFGLGGLQLQGNEIVAGGTVTLESYIGPLLNAGALCWVLLDCEGGAQQIADATRSHHAITKAQVEALLAVLTPSGTIIDFAGASAPAGYLACPITQTNVSRTTYAALFAAIGTTWGAGDGSTTFGLPWFPADYVASQSNGNVGTKSVGEVIAHTHTTNAAFGNLASGNVEPFPIYIEGSLTGSTGGPANLAASVRLLKCIKT